MMRDPAFEEWVEEARRLPITRALDIVAGVHSIGPKTRHVGPCPGCGGVDRFSLNLRKNIFFCRKSAEGGDGIALARHVLGCEFLEAVEVLTGRPAPDRVTTDAERAARAARIRDLEAQRRAEAERAAREQNDFRSAEIERARRIWREAGPLAGSVAERYLAHRGITPGPGAKLRGDERLSYWHNIDGTWQAIHKGPAMVAAIQNPDGIFIGCHITWIDPSFATASGKARILHPVSSEVLDAKKVRGSQKGGRIHLAGSGAEERLVVGEGIETVLSVRAAELMAETPVATCYWSSVNLHNLGGKSAGSVPHPSLKITDARGRERVQKVPGPAPDLADTDVLTPPDHVREIVLLGDGDSEPFATRNTLLRFAARWNRPGRVIRAAWANAGSDFNDMLRA